MARDRAARPEAKPLRLFVAVDLSLQARDVLDAALAPLRADFPKARWVPPGNWHVTVKFLGSTFPRLVDRVGEAVASTAAAHAPFTAALRGVGSFPNERRARVLWAGLADPGGELEAIGAALDERLAPDFPVDKRAFSAHVTVARFDPLVPMGQMLSALEVPPVEFPIDRLVLYRSHLRRPAPIYEPLVESGLGSPPAPPEGA
jgi:2'-5' RNA ligase